MTSPEQFEDELNELFREDADSKLAAFQAKCHIEAIEDKLWTTIAQLGIALAPGRDADKHDDDFQALYEREIEQHDGLISDDSDPEEVEYMIAVATQTKWDEDWRLLDAMGLALHHQQYTGLNAAEKQQFKKGIMAITYAREKQPDVWIALYDALLEGEPLDRKKPADITLLEDAKSEHARSGNYSYVILLGVIARALGVSPGNDESLPVAERKRHWELTHVARDLAEKIDQNAGPLRQPDRHEAIHAIISYYELSLTPDTIANVLALSDAYTQE